MPDTTHAHGGIITSEPDQTTKGGRREEKMKRDSRKSTAESSAGTYKYNTGAKAITALHRINQRGMKVMENDIDGQRGSITINGIVFTLGCFNTARLNTGAKILADFLLTRFTEIAPFGAGITPEDVFRVSSIEVTLKEFQAMRGLKDPKNARAQFKEVAHALFNVGLNFDYPIFRKKGRKTIEDTAHVDGPMFICTEGFRTNPDEPLRNSRIIFTLNPKLLHYLCHRSILPVDVRMFAIDCRKNPHGFHIMRALTDYYHLNATKKNEFVRYSVRSLIEACPELPKIDEIRNSEAGQLSKRIKEPIDRDLDALEDTYGLIKHQYSHRKGKILTDEELEKMPFATWLDLMIEYYLPDYPVETAKKVRKLKQEQAQQEDTVIIPE